MSNQVDEMARQEAEEAKGTPVEVTEPVAEPAGEQVYVVQKFTEITTATGLGSGTAEKACWADIATVKVPPRTKRATVIKQALKAAGIIPAADGSKPRLRALDVDSAEVFEPEAHQPAPEWRL